MRHIGSLLLLACLMGLAGCGPLDAPSPDGAVAPQEPTEGGESIVTSCRSLMGTDPIGCGSGTTAPNGYGVWGDSHHQIGVYGTVGAFPGVGVQGDASNGGAGVAGHAYGVGGIGVEAVSQNGIALHGDAGDTGLDVYNTTSGFQSELATRTHAAMFRGPVQIVGSLTQMAQSAKIDHPLDPANKYLQLSSVGSPDMKNVHDGVVELDEVGEAVVELPAWFEALNRDYRYQLTPLGEFAPVYVAEGIRNHRFLIKGGRAGVKVSWQVTGIRHDAWAEAHRTPVEEEKPASERGRYLYSSLQDGVGSLGARSRRRDSLESALR